MRLFLIYSFFYLSLVKSDCPKGFEELPRQDGCVIAVGRDEFYIDVIRYCYALKAIPAKILNVFDNSYVFALLQTVFNTSPAYIGVEKKPNEVWTYADGSPLTYNNWALNEPRVSNSSICAIMDSETGRWYAAECSFARPFFCSTDQTNHVLTTQVPATQQVSTISTILNKSQPTLLPNTHSPIGSCPPYWSYFDKTGYCYYVSGFLCPYNLNWALFDQDQGESDCRSMNSHLVSIHSDEENDFVRKLIHSNISPGSQSPNPDCPKSGAWIGLVGSGGIGNGRWTDGSPVDYTGSTIAYAHAYEWNIIIDSSCLNLYGWNGVDNGTKVARYACKSITSQANQFIPDDFPDKTS